jgi:hypothetical protein
LTMKQSIYVLGRLSWYCNWLNSHGSISGRCIKFFFSLYHSISSGPPLSSFPKNTLASFLGGDVTEVWSWQFTLI